MNSRFIIPETLAGGRKALSRAIAETVFGQELLPFGQVAEEYIVADMRQPAPALKLAIAGGLMGHDMQAHLLARALEVGEYVSSTLRILPNIQETDMAGPKWRQSRDGKIHRVESGEEGKKNALRSFVVDFQLPDPNVDYGLAAGNGFVSFYLPARNGYTLRVEQGHEMLAPEALSFLRGSAEGVEMLEIIQRLVEEGGSHDYYHAVARPVGFAVADPVEAAYYSRIYGNRAYQQHSDIRVLGNYELLGFFLNAEIAHYLPQWPQGGALHAEQLEDCGRFDVLRGEMLQGIKRGALSARHEGVSTRNILGHAESLLVRHMLRLPLLFSEAYGCFDREVVDNMVGKARFARATLECAGVEWRGGKIHGTPHIPLFTYEGRARPPHEVLAVLVESFHEKAEAAAQKYADVLGRGGRGR